MLRTMITDTPFAQKWVLQGRLCGQWAVDFKQRWDETRHERRGRKCVVNLEDVTCVDEAGEAALRQIVTEGCEVVASRAYMKSVLESLMGELSHVDR